MQVNVHPRVFSFIVLPSMVFFAAILFAQPEAPIDTLQSAETLEQVFASIDDRTTVLFFHANWCPTCGIAIRDLESRTGEWGDVLQVWLVDIDEQRALRNHFRVARQHTWVVLDHEGQPIQSWNGGGVGQLLQRAKSVE